MRFTEYFFRIWTLSGVGYQSPMLLVKVSGKINIDS